MNVVLYGTETWKVMEQTLELWKHSTTDA
jgi:hypothetical protein